MIDLAILGLLKEQDLHGYELKKQLVDLLGARSSVSFGSLYPALARLERDALVKAVEAETQVGRTVPSSGSLKGELAAFRARHAHHAGGRGRKVYGITERGEGRLLELLAAPQPVDDRGFAVKVALCRFLAPDERIALFERRRAELVARLADRRRAGARDRERDGRADRYSWSLRDHDDASITHDVTWLDELIAAERADAAELHESPNPQSRTGQSRTGQTRHGKEGNDR